MNTLTRRQKDTLKNFENLTYGFSCQGKAGRFLDLWIISEKIAKRLIKYYSESESRSWRHDSVNSALIYFNIEIPEHLSSEKLFSANADTPRKLRNKLLHNAATRNTCTLIDEKGDDFSQMLKEWIENVTM